MVLREPGTAFANGEHMSAPPTEGARRRQAHRIVAGAGFLALVLIVALIAPYHTGAQAFGLRTLYWGGLILLCGASWGAAYAAGSAVLARAGLAVEARQMWASLGACAVFAVPLPFAIGAAEVLAFGVPRGAPFWPVYGTAVAISFVIWLFIFVRESAERWSVTPAPRPAPTAARPAVLERAGIADAASLVLLTAEDHYLRAHLADGTSRLVLYRLQQAAEELGAAGLQVHRSHWVAAHAVTGAERRGRRHALTLASGQRVPVGDSFLSAVRAAGWLG